MSRPIQTPPHVQPPRARRKARIASVMAAALVISCGAPAANAYWQTLGSNPATAKADSILAMTAPIATAPAAGSASVSWALGTTAGGRAVSGYTVARYSLAGGEKVAAGGACAGTVIAPSCSETALPSGTWYYTVTPVLGSWAGLESARSLGVFVADTTKPDPPVIIAPAYVNSLNVSGVPVRGTAEPSSSVTVTVSGSGSLPVSKTVTTNESGDWTTADFNLTAFSPGAVTYTATAKDAAGNVSDPRIVTRTKDVSVPIASTVSLENGGTSGIMDLGDKIFLKFNEALDPSTICSGWSAAGGSQTVNQVLVTVGSDDVLRLTADGCTTMRVGKVGLVGNYAGTGGLTFAGSSLSWNVTANQLTITLGTGTGSPLDVNGNVRPNYTPDTGIADIAGNPLSAAQIAGTNSKL
ncbi:Ig-like domain-containing protein [Arthrobacter sp. MDT3-24]